MSDPFIIFGAPDIQEPEIEEVVDSLRTGWLGTGPKVKRFEQAFAAYKGVQPEQVAALNSCTAALHVSLIAAGIGPGDEVITTAMTFCATVNAIIHAGATPVLADIDPDTLNISAREIESKITPKTRAILPVHFAGRACDMDAIMSIATAHNLIVVEDCAHAIETEWRGQAIGTFGDFACFSFYVTKNVATGEGGMVIARSQSAVERIKILSLHGMSKDAWHRFGDSGYKHYYVVDAGFKYNMMDLQAAIGLHQLARVEDAWLKRRKIWQRYQAELCDLPLTLPNEWPIHIRHAHHLYTVCVSPTDSHIDRDDFVAAMSAAGIGVGVHYQCLAAHPFYQERFGWKPEDYPAANEYGCTTVSLPLSPNLSDSQQERVIAAAKRVLVK